MRKEKAIIQSVIISRKAELRHFQIKVPRDAEQIIAVETSVRFISPFNSSEQPVPFIARLDFVASILIGELRLQSCEEANLFYSAQLYEKDANVGFADFSLPSPFVPIIPPGGVVDPGGVGSPFPVLPAGAVQSYTAHPWTHGRKQEEDSILVDGDTTIISGTFKDRVGENKNADLNYEVKVILWYNLKTSQE